MPEDSENSTEMTMADYSVLCENQQIEIGKAGENLARSCTIDYSAWLKEYGEGDLRIRAIRSGDAEPYPVTNVTTGNGVATWTFTDADTAVKGYGEVQILYYVEDVLVKSRVWRTYTHRSLSTSSEEVPDPYQDWLSEVERIGSQIEEDAESASDSATRAAGSASEAAESALSATRSESSAQEYASEASASAASAASSASAASQSASEASTYEYYSEQYMNEAQSAKFSAESARTGAENAKTAAQTAATESEASATAAAQSATQAEETAESIEESADLIQKLLANQIKDTATGTIATYPDGADMPMVSLVADIEPIQDGTPWIGTEEEKIPYLMRAMSSVPVTRVGNRENISAVVGGTVVWNQLAGNELRPAQTRNGVTYTPNNDGTFTLNGTADADDFWGATPYPPHSMIGHKYLFWDANKSGAENECGLSWSSRQIAVYGGKGAIVSAATENQLIAYAYKQGTVIDNVTFKPQLFDLTQMFGSTIADYIYSLEQANTGDGVAFFKALFPKSYYAYDEGSLKHVEGVSSHDTVGFNQFDGETELGGINTYGDETTTAGYYRSKNYMPVIPNMYYYTKFPTPMSMMYYDIDKRFISWAPSNGHSEYQVPDNARYMRFRNANANTWVPSANDNICINISNTARNGEYEAYVKHTYPLDSSLTLRGIPKIDNGNLYYDGDEYKPNGTVTRKYGIVDLGTLTWTNHSSGVFWAIVNGKAKGVSNIVCSQYETSQVPGVGNLQNRQIVGENGGYAVYVKDTGFTTDATAFKTAMSGVYLVYELATPTTETASAYEASQIIDADGTEEYVDTRDVAIPVGHVSKYQEVFPISGWDSVDVTRTGVNVWDGTAENGKWISSYTTGKVSSASSAYNVTDFIPVEPNKSYYMMNTGSSRNVWYDANKNAIPMSSWEISDSAKVITAPLNARYIRFTVMNQYVDAFGVNYPSTDHDYHAYQGQTYQTTLPQTVYGGTLDVVSGVLTVDRAMVDLGTLTWVVNGNNTNTYEADVTGKASGSSNILCSNYQLQAVAISNMPDKSIRGLYGTVVVKDDDYTTVGTFTTAMSGVQLVYELATPTTIQLTPTQIDSLLGRNNVWANSGDVTVEYIADTKLYIQKAMGAIG